MATKKKPAVKKPAAKPVAKKAAKPAPKKAAKPVAKPAPKKAAAKPAPKKAAPAKPAPKKAAKPVAKPAPKKAAAKPAPKKAAPAKPAPKKVAAKPAPKPAVKAAPAPKVAEKPAPKPVAKPAEPVAKKAAAPAKKEAPKQPEHEFQSLVSVKPQPKQVLKKAPPKPAKVVIPKIATKSAVKYEPEFTKSVLDPMQEQSGLIIRYSDADLAEFKEIIMRKLDAAKKELAYLQGLITRRDEGGDMDEARYMTMEDGSVSMEREQLSQMASRQITFIDHLEKALMRIENKTYGICRVTGKLIDKARLRAVPHATLSIEAKQGMNK
ncbi:TraR/DksA family transcriptional regulator [Terrimonas rubra]|uniref:TraR/DksA family transcriptional regulator n=1 Tax=Terrimonas rubra TaxID=1035890 RepID=A0ABW6A1Q6_9BACT